MSDLAPFVAATLRDKVVDDLMKENAALQQKLSRTQKIEVTGPNGAPVYATGMLDQGEYGGGGTSWRVNLERVESCALVFFTSVEIRVGGSLWTICDPSRPCCILDFLENCYDADRMGLFDVQFKSDNSHRYSMQIRAGPFIHEDDYRDAFDNRHGDNFQCLDLHALGIANLGMKLSFRQLVFDVANIKTTLENLGIRDMDPDEAAEQRRSAAIVYQRMLQDPLIVGHREEEEEFEEEEEEE
mmetsp:Transcript_29564/g.54174  ORF Transcript_29564/g.54174 Transcript_29564/m.54174 type:complete len:242 (-) Transcript_29564:306-1031(-)